MEQRQYINREYKNLFGVCVCVWGGGGGGRRRRGTKTVNVPFLIPQFVHKVPFLIIQRASSALFYIVTMPFFVPGVNTNEAIFHQGLYCP